MAARTFLPEKSERVGVVRELGARDMREIIRPAFSRGQGRARIQSARGPSLNVGGGAEYERGKGKNSKRNHGKWRDIMGRSG